MDAYRCPCGYRGLADLTQPVVCGNCKATLRVTHHFGGFQTIERKNEAGGWTFVDMDNPTRPRMIV